MYKTQFNLFDIDFCELILKIFVSTNEK